MSANQRTDRPATWAVAVEDAQSIVAHERGLPVCQCLQQLGYTVSLVEDGDPAGLKADFLLFMENLADFGRYRTLLARATGPRPVTAVWMLETLPPPSLTPEADRIGCAAAAWQQRLGLQFPKRQLTTWQKRLTLRGLRQWLYKQISAVGYRRTLKLLQRLDPTMADTHWTQIRSSMVNWDCLRQTRREGWLDHCLVSTQQRQRFLEERGWSVPFVPLGCQEKTGRLLSLARDIDVLFLGYVRKDRRRHLLKTLETELSARGISLRVITGNCYGEDRIQLLNRTRILVMLHQYSWSPAWIRFGIAAQCGACVVSEPMPDTQPYQADIHYAPALAAQIPEVIQRLLRDEAERSRLVSAAAELGRTSLTLHHSVRQIAQIVTRSMNR